MRTIQRMLYPTIAECKTMRCNFYPDMTAIYIVYKSILQKVRYKNSSKGFVHLYTENTLFHYLRLNLPIGVYLFIIIQILL